MDVPMTTAIVGDGDNVKSTFCDAHVGGVRGQYEWMPNVSKEGAIALESEGVDMLIVGRKPSPCQNEGRRAFVP